MEKATDADYKQLNPLLCNKEHTESPDSKDPMDMQDVKQKTADSVPLTSYQFQRETKPEKAGYGAQVLAALSVSLGSMVVGFSSSYTSPALISMYNDTNTPLHLNAQIESWIGSIMPLSALFGGIAGGPSIEYLGRRNTILATAFPFIAAWLLIALATNIGMILAGRALSGFCVGVASLALPVYLGETIQPEVRGTLGLLPTAFGNTGILLCFAAGMYLNWSHLALLGATLPIPFMILVFMIPETPRWFISKGKTKKARQSLQWLRGKNSDISEELTAVEKSHVDSERNASQSACVELFKGNNLKPLLISLGLMFFQQMSGINAIIFYTVEIFQNAGSTIDQNICTIIVGIVNFLSTFIATALIDRLGRKVLLYISSASMILTLVTLGFFFYQKESGAHVASYGWLPLASLVIYVIGFSLGFGPIPWLMMGEILPAKIRGSAASIVTGFNWSCTFIVTKTFKDLSRAVGDGNTFWLFAVICVVGLIFVVIAVPETRGRSLEEIEKRLTGPVRRMSAVANMKPMPTAC
ncbi:facilitated trehalose transporter Tret1 isoform X2 [Cephus cinctus]|nr:facilitated trehalose transporter Tret1 isoform X2 [Cephus cinctus]